MKALFIFVFLLSTFATKACPFCNTKTATEIRASLFGADLPFNLFVTVLPFAVFACIVFFIYRGGITSNLNK